MGFLRKNRWALLLMVLGAVFFATGVWRGEDQTIFRKAVNICMECIGLG